MALNTIVPYRLVNLFCDVLGCLAACDHMRLRRAIDKSLNFVALCLAFNAHFLRAIAVQPFIVALYGAEHHTRICVFVHNVLVLLVKYYFVRAVVYTQCWR